MQDQIIKELATLVVDNMRIPVITSPEDFKKASDSIAFLKSRLNQAESIRTTLAKPYLEKKRDIDQTFKKATLPLEKIVDNIRGAMLVFQKEMQEKQRLLEETAGKLAAEAGLDDIIVEDNSLAKVQSDFSSSAVRSVTKYRVKDEALREAVEVKPLFLKKYLENNKLPDFLESYEEENIYIRSKV